MKGAYQDKIKSSGMTMIELLVSFSIFLIIVSIVPMVFTYYNTPKQQTTSYEEQILFLAQLQLDFRMSRRFWTNEWETVLYFTRMSDGATVQYELYQDKVRRRVSGTGHEVFLQRVKGFRVEEKLYGITIRMIGLDGEPYEAFLVHPQYFKSNYQLVR